MIVKVLSIGKTKGNYLIDGLKDYQKRLPHYTNFEWVEIPDIKQAAKLPKDELKKREADEFQKRIKPNDFVILLDEKGKSLSSESFAQFIAKHQLMSTSTLVFVIGGAFGFDQSMYERSNIKLQLSSMTFSHQLIRLILLEQLYRAFTIIKGEPYHNP